VKDIARDGQALRGWLDSVLLQSRGIGVGHELDIV
jgi:hypothetical protein